MFMNSVRDSDSEQCTESKLGWVHHVHTLTQAARPGRAHSACWAPCRGPLPDRIVVEPGRVTMRMRTLARHVAALCHPPRSRYKNCIGTLAPAARRVERPAARVAMPLRRVPGPCVLYRSPWMHCIMTQGRSSATIQGFVSRLSPWTGHARALQHAQRTGRSYRRPLSRPYHKPPGCVVAVSWPSPLRPGQSPQPGVTIQSIVT